MDAKKSGAPVSAVKLLFDNFEVYVGTASFIIIMVLLTVQVISRYVFNAALTWTEELSVALFVLMTYCGISAAVTYRKNLRIDAFLDSRSFKTKKMLLIISNIVYIAFNVFIIFPYINIINNLGKSATSILRIPQKILYAIVPIMLFITSIRLIADIKKLMGETSENIGASKPIIDLDALEKEYLSSREVKE
jgi:TRAP-type C4-dicarboxylate transport system permease small subunit